MRLGKITLVSVIAIIGSAIVLISGTIALIGSRQHRLLSSRVILIAAWGLASGFGVLLLQRWARFSFLIFAGLTGYFGTLLLPLFFFPDAHWPKTFQIT